MLSPFACMPCACAQGAGESEKTEQQTMDFNQQLGIGIGSSELHADGKNVFDIVSLDDLKSDCIQNDNHCFGCTAGMGSS